MEMSRSRLHCVRRGTGRISSRPRHDATSTIPSLLFRRGLADGSSERKTVCVCFPNQIVRTRARIGPIGQISQAGRDLQLNKWKRLYRVQKGRTREKEMYLQIAILHLPLLNATRPSPHRVTIDYCIIFNKYVFVFRTGRRIHIPIRPRTYECSRICFAINGAHLKP